MKLDLTFSNMEKSYFCIATVTVSNCMYEFAVRSVSDVGVVINLLDKQGQEYTPLHIETFMTSTPALFPTEAEKEQYREDCKSKTGWIIREYGADFHQEESQREMTPEEVEAYELVKENLLKEMIAS